MLHCMIQKAPPKDAMAKGTLYLLMFLPECSPSDRLCRQHVCQDCRSYTQGWQLHSTRITTHAKQRPCVGATSALQRPVTSMTMGTYNVALSSTVAWEVCLCAEITALTLPLSLHLYHCPVWRRILKCNETCLPFCVNNGSRGVKLASASQSASPQTANCVSVSRGTAARASRLDSYCWRKRSRTAARRAADSAGSSGPGCLPDPVQRTGPRQQAACRATERRAIEQARMASARGSARSGARGSARFGARGSAGPDRRTCRGRA